MKIDLSSVTLDKDPAGSKSPMRDEDARSEQGKAFDKAVQSAAPPRPKRDADKPEADRPAPPQTTAKPAPQPAAQAAAQAGASQPVDGEGDVDAGPIDSEAEGDETVAEATAAPAADARSLQALLGLLGSPAGARPVADAASPAATDAATDKGEADMALVAELRATSAGDGPATAGAEVEGASTKALRLDVLHMETHFEPRQEAVVLVDAGADGQDRLAAALGDGLKAPLRGSTSANAADLASAKPADGAEGATEPADGVRLRFDEAVARLGRTGQGADAQIAAAPGTGVRETGVGEPASRRSDALPASGAEAGVVEVGGRETGGRDGGGADRDGSTASQAAIADLAARRTEARAFDKAAAASPPTGLPETGGLAGQVAAPIIEALGSAPAPSGAPSSAPGDTHIRMRAGGAAMKTLTIQLQPENLGTLEVSMRLVDGKLTLELAASQADTAVLLAEDRGTLRKVLEHAGFSLDDAAITVVTKDAASAASRSADSGGNSSTDGRSANPQSGREGGGQAASQRGSRDGSGRADPAEAEARPASDRRSGANYL